MGRLSYLDGQGEHILAESVAHQIQFDGRNPAQPVVVVDDIRCQFAALGYQQLYGVTVPAEKALTESQKTSITEALHALLRVGYTVQEDGALVKNNSAQYRPDLESGAIGNEMSGVVHGSRTLPNVPIDLIILSDSSSKTLAFSDVNLLPENGRLVDLQTFLQEQGENAWALVMEHKQKDDLPYCTRWEFDLLKYEGSEGALEQQKEQKNCHDHLQLALSTPGTSGSLLLVEGRVVGIYVTAGNEMLRFSFLESISQEYSAFDSSLQAAAMRQHPKAVFFSVNAIEGVPYYDSAAYVIKPHASGVFYERIQIAPFEKRYSILSHQSILAPVAVQESRARSESPRPFADRAARSPRTANVPAQQPGV